MYMKKVCTGFLLLTILFTTLIGCAFAENYKSVGYGVAIDMDSIKSHFGEYRAVVRSRPNYETQQGITRAFGKRASHFLYLYAFKKKEPLLRTISLTIVFNDGSTKFIKIGDPWERCVAAGYRWWNVIMKYKGEI